MNIGARIIKTGLSVTLAILVANLLGLQPAVISAIAAVMAIQPSVMRSWKYIKEVVIGNIIGGIFATIGFYLFGTEPFYIGLLVVLTISVNLKLGLNKSVNLSVLTVITILTSDLHGSTLSTIFNRFSLVGMGVLSSFLVNVLVLPPKHDVRFYDSVRKLNDKLITLLRIVPQKEISITTYKKEKETIDKSYGKTKELFEILNEEKKRMLVRDRHLLVRKIVIFRQMLKVIRKEIVLVEKIESDLNTMSEISKKETEEIKDTLNELLQYQEFIFLTFEDKILPKNSKMENEKRKRIENKLKLTVNELMKHYDPANEDLWWRLFPIVNALIETEKELENLESLVNNYKIRESKKKKKKRKGIRETIQQIEK